MHPTHLQQGNAHVVRCNIPACPPKVQDQYCSIRAWQCGLSEWSYENQWTIIFGTLCPKYLVPVLCSEVALYLSSYIRFPQLDILLSLLTIIRNIYTYICHKFKSLFVPSHVGCEMQSYLEKLNHCVSKLINNLRLEDLWNIPEAQIDLLWKMYLEM